MKPKISFEAIAALGREVRQKDHIVCCTPTRALCGAYVGNQPLQMGGTPSNPCAQCYNMAADGVKCPDPMCPGDDLGD